MDVDWSTTHSFNIKVFPGLSPEQYQNLISRDQSLLRGRIVLGGGVAIELKEHPRDMNEGSSEIVVKRNNGAWKQFDVTRLIGERVSRIDHAAIISQEMGERILAFQYEMAWNGSRQGFAILRNATTEPELFVLPSAQYATVVLFQSRPDRAEIWSWKKYEQELTATSDLYEVQVCNWRQTGYQCTAPKQRGGAKDMRPPVSTGIEVRP